MNELSVYGKDGLFHNIVKASGIMAGRYAVLQKGAHDLNMNNLISGLDLPVSKYPGTFCLPPISELPNGSKLWESFSFRMLFLTTTSVTGDNKVKFNDKNTNSSMHSIAMDWNDMKNIAWEFYSTLTELFPKTRGFFRPGQQGNARVMRISAMQNDNLSGVMLMFDGDIILPCDVTDIRVGDIQMPTTNHTKHFH